MISPCIECPELLAGDVARHAHATGVEIKVVVGDQLTLHVIDDGIGPPSADVPRRHGLNNMRTRAERAGGHF